MKFVKIPNLKFTLEILRLKNILKQEFSIISYTDVEESGIFRAEYMKNIKSKL